MGNMISTKRDFENENHGELRMMFKLSRKSKRLITIKGGAVYLHIFSQILKKFSLSIMTSGVAYLLRMRKGESHAFFFFFFGISLTAFTSY